jgi:hypothetical protein
MDHMEGHVKMFKIKLETNYLKLYKTYGKYSGVQQVSQNTFFFLTVDSKAPLILPSNNKYKEKKKNL